MRRNEICNLCPSKIYINTRVNPQEYNGEKYMIIGEGPGSSEVIQKEYFVGTSGKVLWSVLNEYGFARKDFYITNTLKCMIKNPKDDTLNVCREILHKELSNISGIKFAICLGKHAFEVMIRTQGGITENSGRVFWNDIYKFPVLVCIHPASTLYNGSNKDLFKLSLSFMMYARILIETFGSMDFVSWNGDSKKLMEIKNRLKGLYLNNKLDEVMVRNNGGNN